MYHFLKISKEIIKRPGGFTQSKNKHSFMCMNGKMVPCVVCIFGTG